MAAKKYVLLFNVRSIFPVAWQFLTSHLQFALTSGIALRLTKSSGQRARGSVQMGDRGTLQRLGLQQIEESHSNETRANLLGVGSAHLCRDRLGTGHKKRLSRYGGPGARAAPSTNHSFNRGS